MKKPLDDAQHFPEEQVRSSIQLGMAQGKAEMDQKKTNPLKNKKRILVYAMSSIAAVFILLVGTSHFSPALATSLSQIPIIGSVFGDSDLIGLQQAQEKGLTTQIGETQTINGISVTLDEILYDQNNITIGLLIESEEELEEFYFGSDMEFTINGEAPDASSGSYGEEILSTTSLTAIQEISVTDEMPDHFDLGLLLQGENGEKFYFSAPIKLVGNIEKVPMQHTETADGIELDVTEFSYGDAGASISFTSTEDAKAADAGISRASAIEFKMIDQDGNKIESHSGGVQGERIKDKMVYTSHKQFAPIDSSVSELTITPYLELPTDGGGVEIDEEGKEKELEFKGNSLQQVEFESFKVRIP